MRQHLGLVAVTTLVALAGCKKDEQKEVIESGPGLYRFSSCEDMRDHIEDAWVEALVGSWYGYGYGYYGWGYDDVAESGDSAAGGDGGGGGPSDYSETNVQEEGVDEADVVKTDGEHLYVLHDSLLSVVKSWPAEDTALVGQLALDGYPYSAFLRGDTLVVLGYADGYGHFSDDTEGWYSSATRVSIVDVSDPSRPTLETSYLLEGSMGGARRIDNKVYLSLNDWGSLPYALWEVLWSGALALPEVDWEAPEAEREAIYAEARELVRPHVVDALAAVPTAHLLPRVSVDDGPAVGLLDCQELYRPAEVTSTSTLSLVELDLDAPAGDGALRATGVMSDGWTVYASTESYYIAQTSWWWGEEGDEISSRIHRFALDAAGPVYAGSGEVAGWLLNQFSMGESGGHLRVATSDSGWWGEEEAANNVFVLDQESMETVGEVRDIAPGERIYAARFVGDRGYLVTFEQVDPLFTLDLSDPLQPRIAGELKIPGYSAYLHPVGDDYLLAVGMDGTDEGQITGLAVSLFDVRDFSQPTLQSKYSLPETDWSWSDVLYDHHAFTYHRDTLAIPMYLYDYDGGYDDWFSGLLVVDVDLDGGQLSERGRVDHRDLVEDSECRYGSREYCEDYYWYAWMRRGVVIEDNLYSVSDYGVKVSRLSDPTSEVARVLFYPAD